AVGAAVHDDPYRRPLLACAAHGVIDLLSGVEARDKNEMSGRSKGHRHSGAALAGVSMTAIGAHVPRTRRLRRPSMRGRALRVEGVRACVAGGLPAARVGDESI